MSQRCAAKAARARLRSSGSGLSATPAGKPQGLPGSEYCSDRVFRAMCDACSTHESLQAGAGTSPTSPISMLAPWQRFSTPLDIDIDVELPLDAIVEDPDERPYVWDLPDR